MADAQLPPKNPPPAPSLTTRGTVPPDAAEYARAKVAAVVDAITDPVLFSRVKVSWFGDPAVPQRALVEAAVDIDGTLVRARAHGHDVREAADLTQLRLRDRLAHRADRERHRSAATAPLPGQWRHDNLTTEHPPFFDRPADERDIVRHKSYEPAQLSVEEAAWDLTLADNRFVLFTDAATGVDTVLSRSTTGDGDAVQYQTIGYGRAIDPAAIAATAPTVPLRVDEQAAPELTVTEARERLDAGNEPFVFFRSSDSGRGNVLYRRYDGHYGLITPAA